ncbi:MAG: peptidoglycan DD-metalloendopeptidase family protein [Acidobacteria bacterium]|nr:peptidoglycan DD-metalloendopeptidase family protein [Acidobacteriota bacterium]
MRRSLYLLIAALVVSLAGAAPPASREQALATIRDQISGLESRLGELRETRGSLEERLERVDLELQLQDRRVAEAEAARALALEQVEESRRRVDSLEAELDRARTGLRSRLRALYRLGAFGYVRLLLTVEPGADPLEAVRSLRFLARRDSQAVERFLETGKQLEEERALLEAKYDEAEEWASQEGRRRGDLAALKRRQSTMLAELRRESDRLAAEAEQLRDKERKLTSLLDRLAADAGFEGEPIQSYRGVLDWPAPGAVAKGFGTVQDPRYRTRLPHHGIDITLEKRSPVRTVYPGKVLFAGPFEGYGSMVVVLHPGRVFTVYGGLESLRAKPDDVLSLGDAVGLASGSLYFEIRVENRPEDPLHWLR